jgi:hypothetical protein
MKNAVLTTRQPSTLDADAGQLIRYHQGNPYTTLDVASLQAENERLQRKVHELTHALEQAGAAINERDEALARQNAALRYEYDARRNKELSAGARHTLIALRRYIEHRTPEPDGWTRIHREDLASLTGQSEDAISGHLQQIAKTGALDYEARYKHTPTGKIRASSYVRPAPLLDTPAELKLPEPRNHGGARPRCKTCGGDTELTGRIYRCEQGHEHIEPVKHTGRQDAVSIVNNQRGGGIATGPQDDARLYAWLVELAGDGVRHIEMQANGQSKYEWRRGAVTPALVERHLRGDVVMGSTLRRADGRTSMLEWDVDNVPGYAMLEAAAAKLHASGAYVLVEPSPAGRGGRLRVLFAMLVDTANARATALHHAPELAGIVEHWPNATKGNGQATRLPFARYRRGDVDAWCLMTFGDGQQLAGLDAARRVFSDERTPAAWVSVEPTPDAPVVPNVKMTPGSDAPPSLVISTVLTVPDALRVEPAALRDAAWLARYGAERATRWFAFVEAFTVAWFKERYTLADVLDFDADGLAFATWRGDTNRPNVRRVGDDGWVDDGATATVRAGDVLEAYRLKHGLERATVLQDTARDILAMARRELEDAARAGRPLAAWLHELVTPAGWRHYDELRQSVASEPMCATMRQDDVPGPNAGQVAHVRRLLDEDNNHPYARRYMTKVHGMGAWPAALVEQLEAAELAKDGNEWQLSTA